MCVGVGGGVVGMCSLVCMGGGGVGCVLLSQTNTPLQLPRNVLGKFQCLKK